MQITSIKYTQNKKAYFALRGKPFIILGTQIRLDGMLHRPVTESYKDLGIPPKSLNEFEIEKYFIEAKKLGFNTLQVPVDWYFIEPKKDIYDYELLDFVLNTALKYDLKIELLWFSTNMCGDTHSNHLPDYIFWDKKTYPRIQAESDGIYVDETFHLMYGQSGFIVLDNPKLMERETKVLKKTMNHIGVWNELHNFPDTVISVQVHNEADGFVRWRIDQRKPRLNGELLSKEKAWKMTLVALENAALAIKESNYKVVTRTNMTVSLDMDKFKEYPEGSAKDVLKLKSIDIVGDDPYVTKPKDIIKSVKSYSQNKNYPHIAENMGSYESTPKLILSAIINGASYSVYDFATPEYFIWMNKGSDYQMDQGILNPDLSYKSQTLGTKKVINIIKKANNLLATKDLNQIHGFNYLDDQDIQSKQETINILNSKLVITTNSGAIGYLVVDSLNIYIAMTEDATIHTDLLIDQSVQTGYFIDDEFIVEESVELSSKLKAGKLYKFNLK